MEKPERLHSRGSARPGGPTMSMIPQFAKYSAAFEQSYETDD